METITFKKVQPDGNVEELTYEITRKEPLSQGAEYIAFKVDNDTVSAVRYPSGLIFTDDWSGVQFTPDTIDDPLIDWQCYQDGDWFGPVFVMNGLPVLWAL